MAVIAKSTRADLEPLIEGPEVGRYCSQRTPRKRQTWFGYLPLWSECVPLDAKTGRPDWASALANVGAGLLIGMRETMGGIVSASLIFSTAGIAELSAMFPFGIGMMWYSTGFGVVWYALFGRLQYAYGTAQDVIGILQASIITRAAHELAERPSRIPATALCIIYLSAVITGLSSLLIGKLGLGKYMLLFPSPVTSAFLGAIGFVILRTSLQTSSGVKFHYFYPESFEQFLLPSNLGQVACQLAMVCFMRLGPRMLQWSFPGNLTVAKLSGIFCQLLPLAIFYVCTALAGVSMEVLTANGWTYPKQQSNGPLDHWTTYSLYDADLDAVLNTLPDMPALVLMAVLCTSTGALSITDRFPTGPQGDPNPDEAVDFDVELTTVGASSILLGLTGGTLTFHTFTSIQLRLDGGTHRIAVLAVATFVGGAFLSGAPIGHYVPKWFLSGLFMNTAFHFLRDALLSYRSLPYVQWKQSIWLPSPQYAITLCGIIVSVFFTPTTAIATSMALSIALFLVQSGGTSPVINVVVGNRVVSRMKRPFWEMRTLRKEGDRILMLYLQGHLFFGSVRKLVALLSTAAASERARYCILSFARVERVDPSAARHLKAFADKGQHRGFRLLCCRMNASVFESLVAVGVVTQPDSELVKYLQGLRWKHLTTPKTIARGRNSLRALPTVFAKPEEPDAFTHETDALDYCDGQIISEFCYGPMRDAAEAALESHMLAYRASVSDRKRFPEWAFEEMNGLPVGAMLRIREYCEVLEAVPQWTELPNIDGALCFILRGAVSLVQLYRQADDLDLVRRGFSFRQGKRLIKRYTPGHIVGKDSFFLRPRGQVVDPELMPRAIVSSALGPSSEVWILREQGWREMSSDMQGLLTVMLCVQMADDDQHSQLQEH